MKAWFIVLITITVVFTGGLLTLTFGLPLTGTDRWVILGAYGQWAAAMATVLLAWLTVVQTQRANDASYQALLAAEQARQQVNAEKREKLIKAVLWEIEVNLVLLGTSSSVPSQMSTEAWDIFRMEMELSPSTLKAYTVAIRMNNVAAMYATDYVNRQVWLTQLRTQYDTYSREVQSLFAEAEQELQRLLGPMDSPSRDS